MAAGQCPLSAYCRRFGAPKTCYIGAMIRRIVTSLIGAVLIVYGIIAAISPLPAGVPLIVLGIIMIALANPAARPFVRRMRRKWRWFDRLVLALGRHGPVGVRTVVEATEPGDKAAAPHSAEESEES